MRYTSIDPATRYIAGSTGKRCLGILCKCLPRERERESFLTARLSFAQRTRGGNEEEEEEEPIGKNPPRPVPLESIRTVAAAPRWREDSCRKQRRAEKKKGRKKLGGKGRGRAEDKGQRNARRIGEERRGEGLCPPRRPGRSTQFANRYSPLFVFTAAGRESTPPPPPSPVICLGQIQSQPRGGFELTINFKRVRRRRPRATAAGEGGERRTQTVFSRVSDRRSAKGINLS